MADNQTSNGAHDGDPRRPGHAPSGTLPHVHGAHVHGVGHAAASVGGIAPGQVASDQGGQEPPPIFGYPELDNIPLGDSTDPGGPPPPLTRQRRNLSPSTHPDPQSPKTYAILAMGSSEYARADHHLPRSSDDATVRVHPSGRVSEESMASVVRLLQDAIPRLTNTLQQTPTHHDAAPSPTPRLVTPSIPFTPPRRTSPQLSPVLIVGHHIPNIPIITIETASAAGASPRVWHSGSCFIFPSPEEKAPLLGTRARFDRGSLEAPSHSCCSGHPDPVPPRRYFRFTREQLMILISMLLVDLSSFASMSIMAPFFPGEVTRRGLSTTIDGVIFSVYALVIFVASPVIGKLLPLMNTKAVYLFGIAIAGISDICFGMVVYVEHPELFVVLAILLRILVAFGSACFLTVIYTLVPVLFPDDMNTVNGMLETAVGVGMCLGPAVGVWLYSLGGFSLPFFGLGGFILVTVPINMMTFPGRGEPSGELKCGGEIEAEPVAKPQGLMSVLCRPGVLLPLAILCATAVCLAILYPTLQPHMDNLGVSVEGVGLVFLMMSAVYAVASPLVGLATDRYNCDSSFMFAGLLLLTLSLNLLGNSPLLPTINHDMLYKQDVIAVLMIGLGSAMSIVPTFASIINDLSAAGTVDIAIFSLVGGLWSSSYSLGEMLGPIYAGFIAEFMSFGASTTVTALLPAVLAVIQGVHMCVQCYRSHTPPKQPSVEAGRCGAADLAN